jgi:hypothetical protein
MKKLAQFIGLFFLLLCAAPFTQAQIAAGTIVESSGGGSAVASRALAYTFTSGATAVVVCGGPSGTSHTITDSVNGGTGWTQAIALTTVGGGGVRVFYRNTMTSGSITVTDTFGASTAFTGLAVFQVTQTSGFAVASVINGQSSGTTRTSANVTPSSQPALVVGYMYNDTQPGSGASDTGNSYADMTGSTTTAGAFWDFGTGSTLFGHLESKRVTATTALPATFITVTTGSTTGTAALVFTESGGGGAVQQRGLSLLGIGN